MSSAFLQLFSCTLFKLNIIQYGDCGIDGNLEAMLVYARSRTLLYGIQSPDRAKTPA